MEKNNEKKISIKTISLKDLWNVLRGCFIFVILAALISTGVMYYRAKSNYVPMYSSTATIWLVGDYGETPPTLEQFANDYNTAIRVMDDCVELIKSRKILNAAGDKLGVSDGYGAFRSAITVSVPTDTRTINITATATSSQRAKEIVDSVCYCAQEEFTKWLPLEQFNVWEEGTINTYPVNGISLMGYAKYGIIAGGLVYIIFLAMFLFDNYIRTEEDIEHYLGLSILGDIPDANASNKRKKKYTNYKGYAEQGYGSHSSDSNNSGKKD